MRFGAKGKIRSSALSAEESKTMGEEIRGSGASLLQDYSGYKPRTELGRRLWEIRARIVASGASLLDWDDIEREVAARRESTET